jgi:lipopolysaccharide heptosyltransferase I
MDSTFRVLIVKPSSLGDIINAFPAAGLVAELFPGSEIDWLANPAFLPILEYNRHIKDRIAFPRRELGTVTGFPGAFLSFMRSLRKKRYDVVIDLQGLLRSAFFAFAARSGLVAGFSRPREPLAGLFYRAKIDCPPGLSHAAERNAALVGALFKKDHVFKPASLPVIEENRRAALETLSSAGVRPEDFLIAVMPGARWETKKWEPSFFAALIDELSSALPDAKYLLLGAESDSSSAAEVAAASRRKDRIVSLTGKTSLGGLVETLRICKAAVSNDSGPMHIAAALDMPLLALFGPTDPDKTGPVSSSALVLRTELDCAKCLKRRCPRPDGMLCHRAVPPREAALKLFQKLKETER